MRDFGDLEYRSSCRHNPMVPIWVDKSLERALSVRSMRRYSSMSEFVHDLVEPNKEYLAIKYQPFIERNPLLFWKLLSALLAMIVVVLLVVK